MKILVVAKNIAIYRADLLQFTQQNLPLGSQITVLYADEITPQHGWADLSELDKYNVRFIHVQSKESKGLFRGVFRKLFSDNKNTLKVFPSAEFKKYTDFDVLWVHELNEYTIPALWKYKNNAKVLLSTEVGKCKKIIKYNWSTYATHYFLKRYIDGVIARSASSNFHSTIVDKPRVFAPYGIHTEGYRKSVTMRAERRAADICRLVFVGQFIERKGIDLLADACLRLKSEGVVNFKVRLVGSGDDEMVNEIIKSRNLEDYMENDGFCLSKKLPEIYSMSDVFVFPTRSDTHAVVVHEAAACGLALVVSKYAGSAELLVEEGFNGHIVDPYDSREFAQKLKELIMDESLVKTMGLRSEKKSKQLCVEVSGRKVAEFLKKIL